MQYLVLLYDDMTTDGAVPGTPEWDAEVEAYAAFGDLAGPAILGGEALDVSVLRTVHHQGGEVTVSDGPFAEVAEGLGGFYVLEAPDLDAVIDLARHIPAASTPSGALEIRPMVVQMPSVEAPPPAEGSARYLATIHGSPGPDDVPDTPEWDEAAAAHRRFAEQHATAILGGGAVHPSAAATTIRVRSGELLVSDGPFLEAIEVVGGYYLLHGTPERVALAAEAIPVPDGGAVQLSGIVELGEM